MDNAKVYDSTKHEVKIIDRSLIYLSGIDKIISFDRLSNQNIINGFTLKPYKYGPRFYLYTEYILAYYHIYYNIFL